MFVLRSCKCQFNQIWIITPAAVSLRPNPSPGNNPPKTSSIQMATSGSNLALNKQNRISRTQGATEASQHSINEDEKEQFTEHINAVLEGDKDLGKRLPINPFSNDLFTACNDGLVLSKLINSSVPDTIDERVLNTGDKLNPFQMTENNNLVINSAKAIGCSVVNIGSQDLIEGKDYLVMGLVWQIIKIGLFSKVSLSFHPELYRLLEKDESLDDFLKLPAEAILLRWFNYHLKAAGWKRTISNFSSDIKDSELYTVLLSQLVPSQCDRHALKEEDLHKRAEMVLQNADKVNCRKYLTPKAIVGGNPKLNLAFVANLFNEIPGLAPLTEAEMAGLDEKLFGAAGDREARAFALWMNSLGVEPFVNNIYDDLRNGIILLQTMDKVKPGIVHWPQVNMKLPLSRFKCIENTNYVVTLGKQLKFTLVGIQGADLTDGVKILTLGLVWQLMREHIVQTLKVLSKGGKDITDADIIAWANAKVKLGGKSTAMTNFKDSALRTSHFFIDLLASMRKGLINYSLVTPGNTDEEAKMNAKYAISAARKLGATIFLLPEDIVEVKPKMILTFVGSLMAIDKMNGESH